MGRLDDVTLEELQKVREQTEGEKPRERVLAAIGRKQGNQIDTLAERHDVVEKTIRNWLDRFADQPIEQAPYDAPRPGGPSKLTTEQREHLEEVLQDPPTELGYDQQAWSPKVLLHYVACKYDVEYSKRHARYLLTKAGLSWRTARLRNHEADPEEEAEFQATVEKKKRSSR
jgi:transposase